MISLTVFATLDRVVAAAAGRIVAIHDGQSEQQSGRPAAECCNNHVWIAHANGEWTTDSHLAHRSVTEGAGLSVDGHVEQGKDGVHTAQSCR